jgi:hypothetical protein
VTEVKRVSFFGAVVGEVVVRFVVVFFGTFVLL